MSDSQIDDSSSTRYLIIRLHELHMLYTQGLLLRLYQLHAALRVVNSVMRFLAIALICFQALGLNTPPADRGAYATPMSIALVVFALLCLLQFSFRLYVYLETCKIARQPLSRFQYWMLGFNLVIAVAMLGVWWVQL